MSEGAYFLRAVLAVATVLLLSTTPAKPLLAQSAFDTSFDHFSTSWPLEGAHRNVDCAYCHVGAVFQGTPRNCANCHSRAGLVKATAQPLNHIRTIDDCAACHRETSWSFIRPVDHTAVIGDCRSCHDGRTATGKPPRHIPTSNDCGACHNTRAWTPAG